MPSSLVQLQRNVGRPNGKPIEPEVSKRVLIMLMPWATLDFPGLGPALIRSILIRDGIACDIVYGNMVFSRLTENQPFVERQLSKVPMSEVAFTPYYFDTSTTEAAGHLHKYILGLAANPSVQVKERFPWIVERAGACLDELFASIPWEEYDIVGFSVMMQQTVASLALARRIKARYPNIRIVFGGPNTSWPMGEEMLRCFPEIDFVIEGEADAVVTQFVNEVRSGASTYSVPGLVYRDETGALRRTASSVPFNDLNALPVPDYAPFFEQLETNGLTHVQPSLQIETARGCWWGEKHHCTFCGIDDSVMKFRSKSEEKVLDEILTLSFEHQHVEFFVVDSIIDHRFFKTLLPKFGTLRDQTGFDFSFFFECKSNLRREHVQMFRYAGVKSVQPGIESFNDHVLQVMDKGTTGARQIQCLKLLAENDIVANWNMIYQNQFETADDYRQLIEVIPSLHHLPPVHDEGLIPLQLNRFAPNHNSPEDYGITNVRPKEHYAIVFPDPKIDLDRLAFYFDFDAREHDDPELKGLYLQLQDIVENWRLCYRPDSLLQIRGPRFVQVIDRRVYSLAKNDDDQERFEVTTFEDVWADIFVFCDELRTEGEILRHFPNVDEKEIKAFLKRLEAQQLIHRSLSGQIVNLPLLKESRNQLPNLVDNSARYVSETPVTTATTPAPVAFAGN